MARRVREVRLEARVIIEDVVTGVWAKSGGAPIAVFGVAVK
jgi:hypothetical protein